MDLEQYLARYGVNALDQFAQRIRALSADAARRRQLAAVSPWRLRRLKSSDFASNREALTEFYNLLASEPFAYLFEPQKVNSFRQLIPRLVSAVPPGAAVLDAGCHAGLITNYLALVRPDARFRGLDLAGRAVDRAHEEAGGLGLRNVTFQSGDLLDVSWKCCFDVVLATSVLMELSFGPPDQDEPSPEEAVAAGVETTDQQNPLDALADLTDDELDGLIESTRLLSAKVDQLARATKAGGHIVISIDFPEESGIERRLADRHRALIRQALAAAGFCRWHEQCLTYLKYQDQADTRTGRVLAESATTWLLCSGPRQQRPPQGWRRPAFDTD